MKYFYAISFSFLAITMVACSYLTSGAAKNTICNQQYALCTSAKCIPDPTNPNKAICFCEVHEGKSLGDIPCEQRYAHTDSHGIRHVLSTFSFDDFASKKAMVCPSGMPWTNCLDQPCTVDPTDCTKAICECKIVRSGAFETFGGDCDLATCESGYWSGATVDGAASNVQFLMSALGLNESPLQCCPE